MAPRQASLGAARWQRCKEIFGEVLSLPEDARGGRIEEACAGDESLSGSVRALLEDHARSGGFLEPPAVSRSLHARLLLRADGATDEDPWLNAVIGGRYRIQERIGGGGAGEVYRGQDLLTSDRVACKVLRQSGGSAWARTLRTEAAALRLLRIPGVVRMIEAGTEEGRPYLVMELVEGEPFPGVGVPVPWPQIAKTAISLLETLGRLHQAGFVHRDLKPANVLVDREGTPTVLDLGIALHPGKSLRDEGAIMGTPNYLSPEQLAGEPATPASDLYAVGVMLFEALAGNLPHDVAAIDQVFQARRQAIPSLAEVVPACPADVAELVRRLLKPDPNERPQTAAEALSILEGTPSQDGPARLPWLGGDEVVQAVVAAAERGESVDIHGGPGSGRTRCLEEAAARLGRAGKKVLWFRPGRGFADLLDVPETAAFARLEEARDLARARLAERLQQGAVAIADDWEELEPWVAELLGAGRERGAVVRALDREARGARPMGPLSREDLRDLFHGPDRVYHLREDAAAILHEKSRGLPGAVVDELSAWVKSGCARWEQGRLRMTREALDRIEAGEVSRLPALGRKELDRLPANLRKLLALVQIAGRQATPEGLAPLVGLPMWQVDAQLRELRRLGVVLRDENSPALVRRQIDLLSVLTQAELRSAHLRLAATLPPGDAGRYRHLLAGGDLASVPAEARLLSGRFWENGRPGLSITVLQEALATATADPGLADLLPILEDLVHAGLRAWSRSALDRALYEIETLAGQTDHTRRLGELVRSALALIQGTWERSLIALEEMEPFSDGQLELARQTLRVFAARRGGLRREQATVADVSEWAATCGIAGARRSLLVWLGWLRYNESRFAEAASLHEQAAALAPDTPSRAASLASRLVALADDYRLEEAKDASTEALGVIKKLRYPTLEVRLLYNERSISYRLGRADALDAELPDLARQTGALEWEAMSAVTEAAVAWRLGDLRSARRFAAPSARVWRGLGLPQYACLSDALRLASSSEASEAECLEVAARSRACPKPGIGVQALGLLAISRPDLSSVFAIPEAMLRTLPRRTWPVRREVLSIEEALHGRVERNL